MLIACALGTAPRLAHAQTSDLAKPRSAVEIVLDSSRVMGRERLSAARAAIARAAGALPEGTPLGLRVYGNKAPAKDKGASCVDSRAAAPVGPADPAALSSALKDLKPTGRAPLSLALTRAKKDLPASGERTIVLVAGGADSCATPSPCQPIGSAGAVPPVRVDVIGLQVDAAARRALQCSALTSAGVYRDASTPDALGPELSAALDRATRDRRSLGKPLAGGLEEAQGTFAKPGQYVDSIGPDTERWYTVPVARGRVLSVAATLVAPPTGDVSAPGSSLDLQATNVRSSGGSLAPGTTVAPTATNLFAFDPSRSITVSLTTRPAGTPSSVRVSLHDSPDKQLAAKLGGRSLAIELLFRTEPAPRSREPAPAPAATQTATSSHKVSWAIVVGVIVLCALAGFVVLVVALRRKGDRDGE